MFVIKYLKDNVNSYVMKQLLRTNNPQLANKFETQEIAKSTALDWGYEEKDIEIQEV